MNRLEEILASLALLGHRPGCRMEAMLHAAFDAKAELDTAFGTGNRHSIALSRLMLGMNASTDRRESTDTLMRMTTLLGTAAQQLRRRVPLRAGEAASDSAWPDSA